jgi:hypothetical protein
VAGAPGIPTYTPDEEALEPTDRGGQPAIVYEPPPEPGMARPTRRTTPGARPAPDLGEVLDQYLRAPEPAQKAALIAGLGDWPAADYPRDELVQVLRAALTEESARIQTAAMSTAQTLGIVETAPMIRELARDAGSSTSVRLDAIRTLGRLGDSDSLGVLEALVDAPMCADESLRAIRRVGTPGAIDSLERIRTRLASRDAATGRSPTEVRHLRKLVDFLLSPSFEQSERDLERVKREHESSGAREPAGAGNRTR